MNEAVQISGRKAVKVLGAACLAAGVVVLNAVIASGAAGAVAEAVGLKAGRKEGPES